MCPTCRTGKETGLVKPNPRIWQRVKVKLRPCHFIRGKSRGCRAFAKPKAPLIGAKFPYTAFDLSAISIFLVHIHQQPTTRWAFASETKYGKVPSQIRYSVAVHSISHGSISLQQHLAHEHSSQSGSWSDYLSAILLDRIRRYQIIPKKFSAFN
jgi:hypothetical protein